MQSEFGVMLPRTLWGFPLQRAATSVFVNNLVPFSLKIFWAKVSYMYLCSYISVSISKSIDILPRLCLTLWSGMFLSSLLLWRPSGPGVKVGRCEGCSPFLWNVSCAGSFMRVCWMERQLFGFIVFCRRKKPHTNNNSKALETSLFLPSSFLPTLSGFW